MNRFFAKISSGWIILPIALLIGLANNCAKIAAPSGGPADKTPPDILSVVPAPGSVSVDPGEEIEIIFSKNMKKDDTQKAVFISPLFFDYPSYQWKGKKLKIKLPEKLKPNTTYSITIGASAIDDHNNKLGTSKSFSFSTGEKINSGKIEGRIMLGALSGMDAWAYRLDSLPPDTFMYLIPDYVTQTDSMGEFSFEFLGKGKYLVIGVDDKNRNQFWTPPSERIALPNQLIELANDSAIVGGIVLVAAEQDTAKPIFSKVISPQTNEINVEFSHQITENTMLRADAFKIIPMEESLATPVIFHVYPQAKNRKIVNIDCRGMVARKKYKLEGRHLESIFMQTADSLSQIFSAGESDTIAPSIAQITPDPSEKAYINGFEIELYFSESIDPELSDGAIKISDSSGIEVGLTSKWKYPNRIIIKPQMKDAEQYNMAIDGKKIVDMQGNRMSDSVVTYKYTTASADTLGLISGRIVNIPGADIIVMAYPQKGDTATTKIAENGSFSLSKLFPSTYYLSAYWDVNRNNQFDAGHVKPIIFSELMAIYEDTVVVRSRWETDIGQFDFNKQTK